MKKKLNPLIKKLAFCALAIASHETPWAAFTYGTCSPIAESDFTAVKLVPASTGIKEPIKMATHADAAGNVDVYWAERGGDVKKYSGGAKTVKTMGTVLTELEYESGLTGIALDPKFDTNHWMYLYYTTGGADPKDFFRISRFTVGSNDMLDMASEKIVLTFQAKHGGMHSGGAMRFDGNNDLWITVGENQAGENGTANTNDLRGKILRIHPTDDGKYTIPAGNLFAEGTAKTRPEIYVMGGRNPYTLALDPVRKAVVWGDVGPDQGLITEEFNFTKVPGNFGYPYFAGANEILPGFTGKSPAAPTNNATGNTGLVSLPAAIPAIYAYKQSSAATGPIYYYQNSINTKIKFPPHFDGTWFVSNMRPNWFEGVTLNAAGTVKETTERLFPSMFGPIIGEALDFEFGPDGALYVLSYGESWRAADSKTGIVRIEYKGSCLPTDFVSKIGTVSINKTQLDQNTFKMENQSFSILSEGPHILEIHDIAGRLVFAKTGIGPARYSMLEIPKNGIYLLRLQNAAGVFSKKLIRE